MEQRSAITGSDWTVRTWKWPVPEDPAPLPEDIPFLYCRRHPKGRDLVPVSYAGEQLFLCPQCGEVYEVDRKSSQTDKLQTWYRLYDQPFYWNYFSEGSLARAYIQGRHPFLERHCTGPVEDAADLLVRYLVRFGDEIARKEFFTGRSEKATVETDRLGDLLITTGDPSQPFPEGYFHVFREAADGISLKYSLYESWTYDGLDDTEEYYDYYSLRISYLGQEEDELPGGIPLSPIFFPHSFEPGQEMEEEEMANALKAALVDPCICKEPFGLSGYYLFSGRKAIFKEAT